MSEYKGIKGFQVQTRTEDPTPYAQALADNPYAGTWGSGGDLNTARGHITGVGILTAALSVGGFTTTRVALNEEYNGTSWSEEADLNTARGYMAAGGTYTSSIVAGGNTPGVDAVDNVETWDGSSWTETTEINTARQAPRGAGSSTATVIFGGQVAPFSPVSATSIAVTELWNGSSWTEVNDLNTARYGGAGFGISTAALYAGGQHNPPPSQAEEVEQWNGSSWTEVADINVRTYLAGAGTTTSGLVWGGQDPSGSSTTQTESWDGSSWTTVNSLATAAQKQGGAGASNSSALNFGGRNPGDTANIATTEEWTFTGLPPSTPAAGYADAIVGDFYYNSSTGQFKNIGAGGAPLGTWASGGSLPTVKSAHGYAGTQTAGVAFAGATSTTARVATSYHYDGSSWSDANNVNTGRDQVGGTGIQTAALMFGGYTTTIVANTELYDGTNWTEVNDLNTARTRMGPIGTSTASLSVGGNTPPTTDAVESWNGSSWTEIAEINTSRMFGGAAGIQTAGLFFGGEGPVTGKTESWDGSSWTEVNDMNTARMSNGMGAGDSNTAALASGGEVGPPFVANVESWDGTSWTEVNDLATARGYHACGGTPTSAIATGGRTAPSSPNFTNIVEEFTADDFQIKTVTQS